MNFRRRVLNIAAGKFDALEDFVDRRNDNFFQVNVDTSYFSSTQVLDIEQHYDNWGGYDNIKYYCNMDIFMFLERTRMKFDKIVIYRFLEHVSFTNIMYFIYLVSSVMEESGKVDIIVPNYNTLADMILNESVSSPDFEKDNILLTTELLNEPSCPHASIWTPERATYFWEFEGRFEVKPETVDPHFVFDGRNIYLRFQAERI